MARIIKITKPTVEHSVEKKTAGDLLFTALEKYGYDVAAYTDSKLKKTIIAIDRFKKAVGKAEYAELNIVDCRLHEFVNTSIPETVNKPHLILRLVSKNGRTYELVNITTKEQAGDISLNYVMARKDPLEGTISFWEDNAWVPKIQGSLAQKIMLFSMLNESIDEAFFSLLYSFTGSPETETIEAFVDILSDKNKKMDVLKICHLNGMIDHSGICIFEPQIGFLLIPRCPYLMGSAIRCNNGNYEHLWYISEQQLRSALKETCVQNSFSYSTIKEPTVIDSKDILNEVNYLIGAHNGKYPVIRTLLANRKKVSIPFLTKSDLEDDKIINFMKNPPFAALKYNDQDISDMLLRFTHIKQWLQNTSFHV